MEINYKRPSATPASYSRGTLAEAAEEQVLNLLDSLARDEVDHYGHKHRRVEEFMLSGNGPTVYAVFVFRHDGQITDALVTYSDGVGESCAPIPGPYQYELYAKLRAYGS